MTAAPCRRAGAAVLLLALAGCTQSSYFPCPGDAVAKLRFTGTRSGSDVCPSTAPLPGGSPSGDVSFTGTVAYGDGGAAWLCLDRPESPPLQGTRVGDHVAVASAPAVAAAGGCTCSAVVVESLEGDLRGLGGAAPSFEGTLEDVFTVVADATTCSTDAASGCRIPCAQRWSVTGAP